MIDPEPPLAVIFLLPRLPDASLSLRGSDCGVGVSLANVWRREGVAVAIRIDRGYDELLFRTAGDPHVSSEAAPLRDALLHDE